MHLDWRHCCPQEVLFSSAMGFHMDQQSIRAGRKEIRRHKIVQCWRTMVYIIRKMWVAPTLMLADARVWGSWCWIQRVQRRPDIQAGDRFCPACLATQPTSLIWGRGEWFQYPALTMCLLQVLVTDGEHRYPSKKKISYCLSHLNHLANMETPVHILPQLPPAEKCRLTGIPAGSSHLHPRFLSETSLPSIIVRLTHTNWSHHYVSVGSMQRLDLLCCKKYTEGRWSEHVSGSTCVKRQGFRQRS